MRFPNLTKTSLLLATLMAFPFASFGASLKAESCPIAKLTPQSYTWNFSREASNLLNNVRADAAKIETESNRLQSFVDDPVAINWQDHADRLSRIRAHVDDISAKLCRLDEIRNSVAPWQKKAIDETGRETTLLADNTADAIHFLNGHQNFPWSPMYVKYANNIVAQSTALVNSLGNYEHLAKLNREQMNTRTELNKQAS